MGRGALTGVLGSLLCTAVCAPAHAQLVFTSEAMLSARCEQLAMTADATRVICDTGTGLIGTGAGARVFVRSGTSWSTEADLPLISVASGTLTSVSISPDGTTAFLGQYSAPGAVAVFRRSGSSWVPGPTISVMNHPTVLVPSPDGTSLFVYETGGSSEFFQYNGTSWANATALLGGFALSPASAAFSNDGSRFALGGGSFAFSTIYVLVPPRMFPAEALLNGVMGQEAIGGSLAYSADGTRLIEGPSGWNGPGAFARVYHRSVIGWTQEATLPSVYTIDSVAMSGDGARAFVVDQPTSTTTQIDAWTRSGASWSIDSAIVPASGYRFGRMVADLSGHRVATGVLDPGGQRIGASVYRVFDPIGAPCTDVSTCQTGLACVDGYCCDGACGGGAADCQACAQAMTGQPNGVCSPLAAAFAASIVCRASTGACELDQFCTPASTSCPSATYLRGVVCRATADVCDVPEFCSGTSPDCPTDAFAPTASICRLSMGDCDPPTHCSGADAACPPHAFAPASTICRPFAGLCDVAEHCTGSSADCPLDALAAAGTVCNPMTSGVCDAPDVCTGMSAACPATFAVGVVCRAPAGACDVPEVCLGTAASCPPDGVLGAGVVCRMSSATCDPAESCDGTSTSCPPDVNGCVVHPDGGVLDGSAGTDAGRTVDASAADASTSPGATTGSCGCRAGRAPMRGVFVATLLALVIARRRRSHERR